jgi:hypothetical protein
MPPAPTRIASTPRQSSRTCWNPAVPRPPVPGASAGNELSGDGGGGLALEGGGLEGGALVGGALVGGGLDGGGLGVPVAEPVGGVAGLDPPCGNVGGVVGVPDEQAETDAVVSMASAAQPSTVPRTRRQP